MDMDMDKHHDLYLHPDPDPDPAIYNPASGTRHPLLPPASASASASALLLHPRSPRHSLLIRCCLLALTILSLTSLSALTITAIAKFPVPLSLPCLNNKNPNNNNDTPTTSLRTLPTTDLLTSQPATPTNSKTTCGTTPSQARAHGCHFNLLTYSWHHPHCFDEERHSRFLAHYRTSLTTWSTGAGKAVSAEEVRAGMHESLVTDWEFYLVHCLYVLEGEGGGEGKGDEWGPGNLHAKQCKMDLLDSGRFRLGERMVSVRMWYPVCAGG
ncbi:hypothetical protein FQN55_006850 [Onygenales sp. PD_40]|nr:hypothetical protein FQN55_006850 [Onygenales sp. PD_40]KAK2776627.1 hypothetical protein FQN53_002535 [Emmonsiellopsis sp. PD_33]